MFYSITGTCTLINVGFAVIDCGGVGFKCFTTMTTLRDIRQGEKATLYTYLKVSEDALDLYGFSTLRELEYFKILIGVSGVGAKSAVAILSDLTPDRFASSVSLGDWKLLTKVNGIGAKTAQRIVLELKDKLASPLSEAGDDIGMPSANVDVSLNEEAVNALVALGFSKTEAASAVAKCGGGGSVEEIITKALKMR